MLLINGMPLVFIEVKKRLNQGGVLKERERMNMRFANKNFRPFINITRLMMFSNNMEYDESEIEPVIGAFYATAARDRAHFNYFREEHPFVASLSELSGASIDEILADNKVGLHVLRPEQENSAFEVLRKKFFCEGGREQLGEDFEGVGLERLPY